MGQCEIHFINRGTNRYARTNPVHAHHFWQIEIGIEGLIRAVIEGKQAELEPEMVFLIPPDSQHSFQYSDETVKWLSLKFHYVIPEGVSPGGFRLIELCPYSTGIRDLVLRCAYDVSMSEEQSTKIISGLLAVFMDYHFTERRIEGSPLVCRVNSILREQEGRHIDIKTIADQMNYSAGHIANMYKLETGMSLKKKIDLERLKVAEGLITHTTMNIGEIARQLEFNNIYSFSRFIHHHTGLSPLPLRQKHQHIVHLS